MSPRTGKGLIAESRTARLLQEVRRTALFRARVPMEAGIGWPIPDERHGVVRLVLPIFGMHRADGRTMLYAPFARVTVDYNSGVPVEHVAIRPPEVRPEPVGVFPHEAVRGSAGQYRCDRARLLELYDELADALASGTVFDDREFADLLGRLVEPGLLPYFRRSGSDFYQRFLGPGPVAD